LCKHIPVLPELLGNSYPNIKGIPLLDKLPENSYPNIQGILLLRELLGDSYPNIEGIEGIQFLHGLLQNPYLNIDYDSKISQTDETSDENSF